MNRSYFFVNDEWFRRLGTTGKKSKLLEVIDDKVISGLKEQKTYFDKTTEEKRRLLSERDNFNSIVNDIVTRSKQLFEQPFFKNQANHSEIESKFIEFKTLLTGVEIDPRIDQYYQCHQQFKTLFDGALAFLNDLKETYFLIYCYENCPTDKSTYPKTIIKLARQMCSTAIQNAAPMINNVDLLRVVANLKKQMESDTDEIKASNKILDSFNVFFTAYKSTVENLLPMLRKVEKLVCKKNLKIEMFTEPGNPVDEKYKEWNKQLFGENPGITVPVVTCS